MRLYAERNGVLQVDAMKSDCKASKLFSDTKEVNDWLM